MHFGNWVGASAVFLLDNSISLNAVGFWRLCRIHFCFVVFLFHLRLAPYFFPSLPPPEQQTFYLTLFCAAVFVLPCYLDTEKDVHEGVDTSCKTTPVSWSAVDMQGWRKNMEDSHIAETRVTPPGNVHTPSTSPDEYAKVFAVFDGHGGREVALFVENHFVPQLVSNDGYKKGDVKSALRETFHRMDEMVDQTEYREEIMRLKELGRVKYSGDNNKNDDDDDSNTLKYDLNESKESESEAKGEEPFLSEEDESNSDEKASSSDVPVSRSHSVSSSAGAEKGSTITASEAIAMFQKLLEMKSNGKDDGDKSEEPNESGAAGGGGAGGSSLQSLLDPSPSFAPGGTPDRPVCRLPDHPVHAGCTAVCVFINGRTVTCANAGDSRSVLCRKGGITEPLSYDHKPTHDTEKDRIEKAGGFVNGFGRVNGNLNLSRSLGDLKYKQNTEVDKAGQMITAEPDFITAELEEGDEFIILGCDGIWDCLTNEEAVEYVRMRIDTKSPAEIIKEMLDEIVSEDPRKTQGIGGDNMTAIIVDLLPQTREYYKV